MRHTSRSTAALVALGFAALAPAARAQTQDLFASSYDPNTNTFSVNRFAGTGPGTFSTIATMLTAPTLDTPAGLAFDVKGDLFVANASSVGTGSNSITEFPVGTAPGTLGPATTFASGLSNPNPLVIDSRGNLFAGNGGTSTITEFAYNAATGAFGAGTTFASGLNQPLDLKADARGDLFVENYNIGTISEFAFNPVTGAFGPAQAVETNVPYSEYLAFGPSIPAPMPEASTTVSLGLLPALAAILEMGGLVRVRKAREHSEGA